jgi:hypothetical protein
MVQSPLVARPHSRPVAARRALVLALGTLAGLSYCSWPLGIALNSAVARGAFASDLEASGEPFSWLFVGLDIVTGAALAAAAACTWASAPRRRRVAACALAGFGVLTASDALVPLPCSATTLSVCGVDLARPNLDDALTGLAMVMLFVAAVVAIAVARLDGRGRFASLVTVSWAALGAVFLAHHFGDRPHVGLQHLMLSASSVLVITVTALLASPLRPTSPTR